MVVVVLLGSADSAAAGSSIAGHAFPTTATDDPPPAAGHHHPPRITIALMPQGTTPAELARVPGMAIGLMSAGIGDVPAEQTYLDVGQGARTPPSLYDQPLPLLHARRSDGGVPTGIPPGAWDAVRRRAQGVPADLVPGLLGSTLGAAGVRARSRLADGAIAMLVSEHGRLPDPAGCASRRCARVDLVEAGPARLAIMAAGLRGEDLLVAIEMAPPAANRALAVGLAGRGLSGTLTSDSTRIGGYVLSTDLAPTVLARLGLAVPSQMTGEPIRSNGEVDPASLGDLADRLAAIGPRRGPVVGVSVLVWAALTALAGIAFGRPGVRAALRVLAVAVAFLPAVLMLAAALEPSELAERLIVGAGAPALAILTLRLAPGFGALAIAGTVSVSSYAVDVIAGSHLTELSLAGPNPAGGVRFFGIGNELEAAIGALVPIATGAGLVAWAPRVQPRTAAIVFGVTAALGVAAFAPGRFGADVGAAIGLPVGAAVAAGVCLGAGRRRLALLLAAPVVALAALVAVDLVSGGDAHLTRTVLRAGGFDQLAETVQRRLELSVHSFDRYAPTAMMWLVVAALVAGVLSRHRIEGWFGDRRWAWAGLLGALGATVVGTLANDSGAVLLILGTTVAGATVGLAWATHESRRNTT
jgi:hypothetical protein